LLRWRRSRIVRRFHDRGGRTLRDHAKQEDQDGETKGAVKQLILHGVRLAV
jgi:hypothetical protein